MIVEQIEYYVIHVKADGTPWLVIENAPDGWVLDDGTWVRELEVDGDLVYTLESEVAFWERSITARSRADRKLDLGDLAREILRKDLARYRHPLSST